MKKIILMLLCITTLVSVASCNRNGENDKTKQNIETTNDISNSDSENNDDSTVKNNLSATSFEEYMGTWYDDFYPPNSFQIISDTNGKIECQLGIYRLTTFDLNISIQIEKISFTDEYNLISGTIELKDHSVLVTVTESNAKYISSGASWLFTIKDEGNFA